MKWNSFLKLNQTCKVLRKEIVDGEYQWNELPDRINVSSWPVDRMGFILMWAERYYEEDRHTFYDFRTSQGGLLYPFPDESEGQVLGIFDVSVRLDLSGNITHYSYALRKSN